MIINKNRAWMLLAAITLTVVFMLAVGKPSADQSSPVASRQNAAMASSSLKTVLFNKVRAAIQKNRLTKIPDRCLDLELESPMENDFLVSIREIHSAECGGDPETSPRLFSVKIDSQMKNMWSDAKSDDGEMLSISP